MEEKLQQILDNHFSDIERYEQDIITLRAKIVLCKEYNLKEEERLVRFKLDAIEMIVFRYKNLHNEIQTVLNKWMQ